MAKAPKRKRQKKTNKKQSERFKNAVRDEGLDVTDESFERTFRKLVPSKKKPPAN